MFSIRCNNRVKSWKNQKRSAKNNKNQTNKYNYEEINFSPETDDWRKFEKNNVTIALNILNAKKEKICSAYVPKHNSNRQKKLFF